jgi:broad specificity phosphatase PhoE
MNRSTRLTLICHGTTAATRTAAFPADEGLLPPDPEVFARIKHWLPHADHIISAPEARARQTAEAIASTVSVDHLLGDIDYGRWAGRQIADIEREEPEGLMAWIAEPDAAPHGGESITQAVGRIGAWLRDRMALGGMTIAVTHPSIARAAIVSALDAPAVSFWKLDIQPLGITELTSDGRRWSLRSFNTSVD